jgi:GDP-D-mannose dehydratase
MDAPSDLGHAKDYLNVQLSTQQQEKNSDYVVGGGGTWAWKRRLCASLCRRLKWGLNFQESSG